jgi:hypothetical protein
MRHNSELAPKLREAVHALLGPLLWEEKSNVPNLDDKMEIRIANLSELTALTRSHVERDRYSREVVDLPVTEGNTRLPQQLCQIARGSAVLDQRTEVNESDFKLVSRAALDSLPPARRAVLTAIIRGENPYSIGLPLSSVHRVIEDLSLVGVVNAPKGEAPSLTQKACQLLEGAGVWTFPQLAGG